jgi:hypothetical protein
MCEKLVSSYDEATGGARPSGSPEALSAPPVQVPASLKAILQDVSLSRPLCNKLVKKKLELECFDELHLPSNFTIFNTYVCGNAHYFVSINFFLSNSAPDSGRKLQ